VYTTPAPVTDPGSSTLVVTCSSNLYQPVVHEFVETHLGLPEGTYDLMAVPGGPQFLMLTDYLPKFFWAGHRWMKFLVEKHRLKRVVLVSHDECAWVNDDRFTPAMLLRLALGGGPPGPSEGQALDGLRRMAKQAEDLLAPIAVEAYYARREPTGTIAILRID
jgi:hypothetical protein